MERNPSAEGTDGTASALGSPAPGSSVPQPAQKRTSPPSSRPQLEHAFTRYKFGLLTDCRSGTGLPSTAIVKAMSTGSKTRTESEQGFHDLPPLRLASGAGIQEPRVPCSKRGQNKGAPQLAPANERTEYSTGCGWNTRPKTPATGFPPVTDLDSDAWVTEVKRIRGKKLPLTAAGVHGLRDGYTRTVEPARALAAKRRQREE